MPTADPASTPKNASEGCDKRLWTNLRTKKRIMPKITITTINVSSPRNHTSFDHRAENRQTNGDATAAVNVAPKKATVPDKPRKRPKTTGRLMTPRST